MVSPGQTSILRIVSLKDMYVKTDVPETYISSIVKGKSVEVLLKQFESVPSYILSSKLGEKRTIDISTLT